MTTEIKAIIAAVLLVAAFAAGWYFSGLREKAVVSREQADSFQALATAYATQQAEFIAKVKQKDSELESLKAHALKYPDVSFSVCRLETSPQVPAKGSPGQVVHTGDRLGTGETKPVPERKGPDYGPSVFGLADAFDTLAVKCRAL